MGVRGRELCRGVLQRSKNHHQVSPVEEILKSKKQTLKHMKTTTVVNSSVFKGSEIPYQVFNQKIFISCESKESNKSICSWISLRNGEWKNSKNVGKNSRGLCPCHAVVQQADVVSYSYSVIYAHMTSNTGEPGTVVLNKMLLKW